MVICEECNQVFKSISSLQSHLRKHKLTSKEYYDKYLKQPDEGICKYCKKPTKFRGLSLGYLDHCSNKCAQLNPNIQAKKISTSQKNYGVDFPSQSKEVQELIKQTTLDRFGVESIFQLPEVRDKTLESIWTDEVREKRKQTCLDVYGVEYVFQSNEIRTKCQDTCLDKYGVRYFVEIPEVQQLAAKNAQTEKAKKKRAKTNLKKCGYTTNLLIPKTQQKARKLARTPEAWSKRWVNQRENHRIPKSENFFATVLEELNIEYIPQYKEERYPYFCDFYIPKKDLFIELNLFWTHGGKFFEGTVEDLNKLKIWKEKAKTSKFYRNAIKTWTIEDLEKLNYAKKNNLNYIALHEYEKFYNFIEKLKRRYGIQRFNEGGNLSTYESNNY